MTRIDGLLDIMARLRDPGGGCPWDLEQDFASISPHTIEEAYEVDEAIASGDREALRDELGDLLFQVVFQARLAEEEGAFDFGGVVEAITEKLIRRHPHVFADAATPSSVQGQRTNWEDIKAAERAAAGSRADSDGKLDPFSGIPRRLPALARSAKVAGRLERLHPDRGDSKGPEAAARALEGIARQEAAARALLEKYASGDAGARTLGTRAPRAEFRAAVGQGLAAWVRLARILEIDPEQALRQIDDEAIATNRPSGSQAERSGVR